MVCLTLALAGSYAVAEEPNVPRVEVVEVDPAELLLEGPESQFTVLVHGRVHAQDENARRIDLTHVAKWEVTNPAIAAAQPGGRILGLADGTTEVIVRVAGQEKHIPVTVRGAREPRHYNFENDIVPLLSKLGCNASGCHGKAEGQNGFKLSVFGFDPVADYEALTKESRGRRVFPAAAAESLLLTKAVGTEPHGGGIRLHVDTPAYRTLLGWISSGLPRGAEDDPHVVGIELTPDARVMQMHTRQQLRVVAEMSNGQKFDVTQLAKYQSNSDALASVDETGLVSVSDVPGQVAVMASYMGAVDVVLISVPRGEQIANYPDLPEANFIDKLVHQQLRRLNILPSGHADDATFLRRIYLDLLGRVPTAAEARQFLSDASADRREHLVDWLLVQPEFADYWALQWADLLRVERQTLGHKDAYLYYQWIRESFAHNKPWDQFARELVTAEGPLAEFPAGNFYRVNKDPGEMASSFSQAFLGVRIACAQCHHHPFDRWSQTDYHGMKSIFSEVRKGTSGTQEAVVTAENAGTLKHPRTEELIYAHPLGEPMPEAEVEGARRQQLAAWMTSQQNPWFARNMANRLWGHMLGRGIVHPVDDVRATNPPTNPELLDALAAHFIEHNYDVRELLKTIALSETYQRSSDPNDTNLRDSQNYSRAMLKRLPAEVLLDAVCQATGVPEKFDGVPAGYRAVQLWDSRVRHYFLKIFGRPLRETACECERSAEASVAQVLHLLNAPEIDGKLAHASGTVARLTLTIPENDTLATELYLAFLSRFPTDAEKAAATEHLANAENRRAGAEDLAWSLMNSLEFIFNH